LDALVCYYQGALDPRTVRRRLDGVLDPYKVPSVFEQVDGFPYTPNGKVDREALKAARRSRGAAAVAAAAAASASPSEAVLRIARGLTGVGDLELDDNFFDVGGDSASAVVLVGTLKELGWVDVGVRDVLRAVNLRALADGLHERSV
jgi:hypothetical protein